MISVNGRRGALLLATLLAVIFAVFAMHSLSSHERSHIDHAAALPLVADDPGPGRDHSGSMQQPGPTEPDGPEGPTPDHDGGAGELCLALLCLMAALIVLALLRGVSRRILYVVPHWLGPRLVAFGRSPDPPCLHRLSILRC
jgi:hypothetical protein